MYQLCHPTPPHSHPTPAMAEVRRAFKEVFTGWDYPPYWGQLCITVTSYWAWWRVKSPPSRLFTQPFIQAQIKESTKASRLWPLWGELTGDRWIPRTKGQERGKCFHSMTASWCGTIFDTTQILGHLANMMSRSSYNLRALKFGRVMVGFSYIYQHFPLLLADTFCSFCFYFSLRFWLSVRSILNWFSTTFSNDVWTCFGSCCIGPFWVENVISNQSINWPIDRSTDRPIDRPTDRSIDRSINQSIN